MSNIWNKDGTRRITKMPDQNRIVINALLDAGYHRHEFSVNTPHRGNGEFERPEITIKASKERQRELLDAVLATNKINVYCYRMFEHTFVLRYEYNWSDEPSQYTLIG